MLRDEGVDAKATPGGKGQFDVVRDGDLLFSKRQEGRFPGEGEVQRLLNGR
jgi:predicted Rdx family selenoprotein